MLDKNRDNLGRLLPGNKINTSHSMRKHRAYNTWNHMMFRCYHSTDSSWKSYGGRGITVCKKWHDFIGFWEDMEEGYSSTATLDRIDNNGNYCKRNCRWATWKQQQMNKRNTVIINYNGAKKTLKELCLDLKLNYNTIFQRLFIYKWSLEDALAIKPWQKKH
jgi:hypothetical protein